MLAVTLFRPMFSSGKAGGIKTLTDKCFVFEIIFEPPTDGTFEQSGTFTEDCHLDSSFILVRAHLLFLTSLIS